MNSPGSMVAFSASISRTEPRVGQAEFNKEAPSGFLAANVGYTSTRQWWNLFATDDGRPKTNDRLGHQSPVTGHSLPFVPLFAVTMLSQETR